eukprot:GGOE01021479.1.p1 GENE.GGOE01021479.1~~GGOE01021479.1.p1  ORF type:complete len:1310 (+),score=413.41 GGOE01021479.1:126-3932(+)
MSKLIDAVPALLSAKIRRGAPLSPALLEFQAYWLGRHKEMPDLPTIRIQLRQAEVQVYCWPDVEEVPNVSSYVKSHAKLVGLMCGWGPKVWKRILSTTDMDFNPGSMTLVLGPPGSGKTTFLKALSGALHSDSRFHAKGVYYNRDEATSSPFFGDHSFAFVDGADMHIPKLTVRQTVEFACECKRKGDAGQHTDVILKALGLAHVAQSLVGNEVIRGVSGGERRRLSIAEVWTSNLRVFLGDRISDGLDSATTLDLVRSLRVWCRAMDATVVVTLLQPPPEAFEYFDQVVMLSNGAVSFCGTPQQGKDVLARFGSEVPESLVPATVTNPRTRARWSRQSSRRAERRLRPRRYGRRFPARLWLCMKRQLLLELDVAAIATKILLNLITGLMTASLWTSFDLTPLGIFQHDALLFHICVSCVLATQGHTAQFLDIKPIFQKQNRSGFYCTASFWIATTIYQIGWGLVESGLYVAPVYFICSAVRSLGDFMLMWMAAYLLNLVCALLFRGCAIVWSSPGPANTTGGLLQVFLFLFSGFLIAWSDLPPWWKWMVWLSPQSYAFSIMIQAEYRGMVIPCSPKFGCWVTSGDDYVLERGITIGIGETFIAGLMIFVPTVWVLLGVLLWAIKLHSRAPAVEKFQLTPTNELMLLPATPIVLTWHNISYCVPKQKGLVLLQKLRKKTVPPRKTLLNGVSGISRPGSMTALMGPSGAGKTTLLDVLAGRKAEGPTAGEIRLNGHLKVNRAFLRISGYVEQFDSHCTKYTVLESLLFSARMRLGAGIPTQDRQRYCENIAAALHLLPLLRIPVYQLAADQRKYLGVAVELVSNPSVLFLDEPTTGLDGLRAYRLMGDVQTICRRAGISVICTIHQPSAPLFDLFSHLVLLCKGGEVAYVGPTGEGSQVLIAYLQGIPTVSPMKGSSNPAHWMLDEVGGGSQPSPDKQRLIVAHFAASDAQQTLQWELDHYSNPLEEELVFSGRYAATRGQQFAHLLSRASKVYWRSPEYTLVRTVILLIFSVIFGTSFWRMPYDADGMFLRMSFCYTTTFYCGLTYLVSAMTVLMSQRPVFYREKDAGMYSPAMYGLAYMLGEVPYFTLNGAVFVLIIWPLSDLADNFKDVVLHFIPFWLFLCMCTFLGHALAAVSPTNEVAFAVGPGIACWFSALSGFYLSPSSIPAGYMWVYWLNPFQYTFDSMVCNMLAGRVLNCTANYTNGTNPTANNTDLDCILVTSDNFLQFWGLRPSTLWYWMDQLVVVAYIFAWIVGAFLALRFLQFNRR